MKKNAILRVPGLVVLLVGFLFVGRTATGEPLPRQEVERISALFAKARADEPVVKQLMERLEAMNVELSATDNDGLVDEALQQRRDERSKLYAQFLEKNNHKELIAGRVLVGNQLGREYSAELTAMRPELNRIGDAAVNRFNKLLPVDRQIKRAESQRSLFQSIYGPVTDPRSLHARALNSANELAPKQFMAAHPSRFVFSLSTVEKDRRNAWLPRTIQKGEPLLVRIEGSGAANVITLDGISAELYSSELSLVPLKTSVPHPLKAEWLTIEDKEGLIGGPDNFEADSTGFYLNFATFLRALEPGDPRIEEFATKREKIVACYDGEMARLDPDNRRKHYDLVTLGPRGEQRKVESLTSNYDRKACAKCGCSRFNDEKRKLARAALFPAQQRKYDQEMKPIIDRLNELFGKPR